MIFDARGSLLTPYEYNMTFRYEFEDVMMGRHASEMVEYVDGIRTA